MEVGLSMQVPFGKGGASKKFQKGVRKVLGPFSSEEGGGWSKKFHLYWKEKILAVPSQHSIWRDL